MMRKLSIHRLKRATEGFTIVELMVATLIFSMVLLLCATAIVQVGRMYYKGIVVNRTEDASRRVIDDITRSIQFGAAGPSGSFMRPGNDDTGVVPGSRAICLGTVRYTFAAPDYSVGTSYDATNRIVPHGLWKDTVAANGTCVPADLSLATPSGGGTELLDEHMRMALPLTVGYIGAAFEIHAVVSYGDGAGLGTAPDLECGAFRLNSASTACDYTVCLNNSAGGQFCAVSDLKTNVVKRL